MSKHSRKKKNPVNWFEIAVQIIVGVISGVISGIITWLITN